VGVSAIRFWLLAVLVPGFRLLAPPSCSLRRHRDNQGVSGPDAARLPAEELTAHQPPALLVERVVALAPGGGTVRLKPHRGLDALQLLEAGAQAVAVLIGARLRGNGQSRAGGMLVGAKGFAATRDALAGEAVEVTTRSVHELGPLQLHEIVVRSVDMDVEIARGELKVAADSGATS
jgi:predicted hotdog family 3-hydroxylacyl-ACP dehydratase